MTPYLFPLDSAICGGHIIILGFIRKINSKYEVGLNLNPPWVLPRCCLGKLLQIAVLTSTPGPLLLTVKQCFYHHPLHHSRFTRQPSQLLGVCVWMAAQVSQSHPASMGGTVSKHAEYRLESNANQLLSYAAPDLWWTLGRWMLPRLSIEISGLEEKEHISYSFPAPASYLEWISKQAGWQRMHSEPHEVFNVFV